MSFKRLKAIQLPKPNFDAILKMFPSNVIKVRNVDPFYRGYPDKKNIYTDGKEYLVCQEYIISFVLEDMGVKIDQTIGNSWQQIIVRASNDNNMDSYERDIDGLAAWQFINKMLKKYYTKEEIEECYKLHSAEYDRNVKQYHYDYPSYEDVITVHHNCYKYDINGAHTDALCEIFPKAANEFLNYNKKKHDNPIFKQLPNYFVGFMCKRGHRETYNWIVQRTTKKLYEAINLVGGMMIYANTDGFIVKDPDRKLVVSQSLGEFKLEYSGDVYTYRGKNYTCMLCGEDFKGSCLKEVRHLIDLPNGIIVDYDRERVKNEHNGIVFDGATNIRKRRVKIYES